MARGIPAGEYGQDGTSNDHEKSVASAQIDQADEQALECHNGPRRYRMRRLTAGRLGPRGLISPVPVAPRDRLRAGNSRFALVTLLQNTTRQFYGLLLQTDEQPGAAAIS